MCACLLKLNYFLLWGEEAERMSATLLLTAVWLECRCTYECVGETKQSMRLNYKRIDDRIPKQKGLCLKTLQLVQHIARFALRTCISVFFVVFLKDRVHRHVFVSLGPDIS